MHQTPTKGDTLSVDNSLSGSLQTGSDYQGGKLLSFNGAAAGIDLRNVADPSQVAIAWH